MRSRFPRKRLPPESPRPAIPAVRDHVDPPSGPGVPMSAGGSHFRHPDWEDRPSQRVLLVPVLLDQGHSADRVAAITGVPAALVELIATENAQHQQSSTVRSEPHDPSGQRRSSIPGRVTADGREQRRKVARILLLGAVGIVAAAVGLMARLPVAAVVAFAGSIVVIVGVGVVVRRRHSGGAG